MLKSILIYTAGWYISAIGLSVYNKWMFDPVNGLGFEYPILMTTCHQMTLWLVSAIYITLHERWDSEAAQHRKSAVAQEHKKDWKFYLKYIVPTAIVTAGDISCSNVSFKFVPLTVYTIIKSSSIAFVLLFGCIFRIEKFHWKLGMIVAVMFIGVSMMVYKPHNDDDNYSQAKLLFGSLLVLFSSSLSGLRWVYTQLILRNTPSHVSEGENNENDINDGSPVANQLGKKPHPIYTIRQLAPIMGITLILSSLIIERPFPGVFKSTLFKVNFDPEGSVTTYSISKAILFIITPGIAVFFLTFSEFGLLQITKVLTVSVIGIIKEVLTIMTGVVLLNERISGVYNWVGMSIVLLDIVYYNFFRYKQKQDEYIRLPLSDPEDVTMDRYSAVTNFTVQEFEMDALSLKLSNTSGELFSNQLSPIGDVDIKLNPNNDTSNHA